MRHRSAANAASHALHGYLTRDASRRPCLALACHEPSAARHRAPRAAKVTDVVCRTTSGSTCGWKTARRCARKLLLATGADNLPGIEGFTTLYGRSVFHCPHCDGEVRDQPLAVYGRGQRGLGLSLEPPRGRATSCSAPMATRCPSTNAIAWRAMASS